MQHSKAKARTRPIAAALLLAATCGSQFMLMVDDTVVSVALPTIGEELGFSREQLPWIVDAYMLALGGFMIVFGRLADLFGRTRAFVVGLLGFTAASISAGLANDPTSLIVARGAQGLAGALLGPAALGLLVATFADGAARTRALGVWGGVTGISGVLGVVLGGMVTDFLGWRWVFLVNAPIAVVILLLLVVARPPASERTRERLDMTGASLVTSGLVLLVWAILGATHRGWDDPRTLGGIAAAAVLLAAFVAWEARVESPILDLKLFGRRGFAAASAAMFLAAGGMYSMAFFLTQYMQVVQGWSPLRTGVSWLSFGVLFLITTGASTKLIPIVGARILVLLGGVLGCGGQLLLTRTTVGGDYWAELAPAIALMGAGLGLAFVPIYVAALHGLTGQTSSAVAGVLGTMQQVGGAVGVASLASLAIAHGQSVLDRTGDMAGATVAGYHYSFAGAAVFMATVSLAALLMPNASDEVDMAALQGV